MSVEKNPVTILQEMLVKIGSTPIYELCPNELDTISQIFTFKVACDGLVAYGSGKSKRDAKQNAAHSMIEKIGQRKIIKESSASSSTSTSTFARDNTVQELMSLCSKLHLEEPNYKELDTTGPPHARVYTTQCTVSKFEQDGSARSKKQSKQNAAKKMIDQIKDAFNLYSLPDDNGNKQIKIADKRNDDNGMEFSQIDAVHQASKLKINYQLKLQSKRKESLKNLGCSASYNILLSNLKQMNDLIRECQLNCTSENITQLKQTFQNVMDTSNIDFHHMLLHTTEPATFMLIIQLNIVPDIIEMSIGKSREEAEWRTISKVVGTLMELLS